ncbi:predicted protein [Chaetoceros tenuissimus]|uniref:Uncharacterized protein n=1 Tax=Chaetoceros tenuissimus TaxID=426638 RepID=A0AAD3D3Y2_9STRA|nr:predicted protein [Chaetoceros tenuissimus]
MKSSVIFAKWWIGEEEHDSIARIAEEYSEELDPVHECQINYTQWYTYLRNLKAKPECELLSNHREAIRYIATTKEDLYASTNEGVQHLVRDLQKYILNLPSHTQYTESGVQDISLASKNRKSQYDASSISIIRAFDNQAVNKVLLESYSSKKKQGNQYRTSGAGDNDRLNTHIRSVHTFQNREKGISQFRRRALPTKERSLLLIQRGIQFIPNEDVIRRIAAYLKQCDLNSQSRKRLRQHESDQFDENKAKRDKKLAAGHKRIKDAKNLKQRPVTLSDTFKKTVEFTWFTQNALRLCCMKEIEARNPNHEYVINGYKIDGKKMIAKQLKELLVDLVKKEDKDATAVELKHPDNILLHEKRYLERLYKGELKPAQVELYLANQDDNEETIECSLDFDF